MKPRNAEKTRNAILESGKRLFAEKGYAGTSMRDIAEDVDIKAATLYHYFKSKEHLLEEIYDSFYGELEALYLEIDELIPEGFSLQKGLGLFMEKHREFIQSHNYFSLLFFQGMMNLPGQDFSVIQKYSLPPSKVLKKIASKWKKCSSEKVLTLFMSIIAFNAFFELSDKYIKKVSGISYSADQQMIVLKQLFDAATELEKKLK